MQKDIDDVRKEIEIKNSSSVRDEIIDVLKNDSEVYELISNGLSSIKKKDELDDSIIKINPENKLIIKKEIIDYIDNNSDQILNSLKNYYQKKKHSDINKNNKRILELSYKIYDNSLPQLGNKNITNEKTIVSFLDPYSQESKNTFFKEVEIFRKNPDSIKIIHHWIPIISQSSVLVSKFIISVYLYDSTKYLIFVENLFKENVYDLEKLMFLVKKIGIDDEKFKDFIKNEDKSSNINKIIKNSIDIFQNLNGKTVPYNIIEQKVTNKSIDIKDVFYNNNSLDINTNNKENIDMVNKKNDFEQEQKNDNLLIFQNRNVRNTENPEKDSKNLVKNNNDSFTLDKNLNSKDLNKEDKSNLKENFYNKRNLENNEVFNNSPSSFGENLSEKKQELDNIPTPATPPPHLQNNGERPFFSNN
ncbi:thioredoxin domain-containing protein [Lyticum sinuosum]|nr:hypothetical protein [Lyticum sinuosum]